MRQGSDTYPSLTSDNFSYAMMALPGNKNTRAEWRDTLEVKAVVLGKRAIGRGAEDVSSLWNESGSGTWVGGAAQNDNAVRFHESPGMTNTRYGVGAGNPTDDLLANETNADDAFLVFKDTRTSYSPR